MQADQYLAYRTSLLYLCDIHEPVGELESPDCTPLDEREPVEALTHPDHKCNNEYYFLIAFNLPKESTSCTSEIFFILLSHTE